MPRKTGLKLVVTFREAYRDAQIRLCREHRRTADLLTVTLGPAIHGEHKGLCDVCEEIQASKAVAP